jgi:maltooligosyltrehalose trehalohydrolase
MLYGFRLDAKPRVLPDPASRFQPEGPEGLSQIVDPDGFHWTDSGWKGVPAHGQVIYEMHVGTFTPQGTWAAAMAELPELSRIGITVIEVMPVADFPGEFGWGYDGVCFFAPTRLYGLPDDFRRFVDRAHACGIGVILDVVYNHYGSIGNSLPEFSENYVTDRYPNEWGATPNFDGTNCHPVREFVEANVRHWIEEYHLDGLRFDATQSIHDASVDHILTRLVTIARESAAGRGMYVIAENEPQKVRLLRPPAQGGHGMDAMWNDDFHHAAMARLTGHNEAYYSDYLGVADEFLATVKHGFLFQGQHSQWQKQPRGTPTRGLPATAFVTFLQNHDQIANSGLGERIDRLTSPGRLRAMTALWLLAPQTPMFFQGQEFAASSPFFYFADNSGDQAQRVSQGRQDFLKQFPTLATEEARNHLAKPEAPSTFERCRLDFSERQKHRAIYQLHIDLLRLRREDPLIRRQRSDLLDGATLSRDCLLVRYFGDEGDDRLLLVNFGSDLIAAPAPQPLLAPPEDCVWETMWSSNQIEYGGGGTPPLEMETGWRIPGECAVLLRAASTDPRSLESENKES